MFIMFFQGAEECSTIDLGWKGTIALILLVVLMLYSMGTELSTTCPATLPGLYPKNVSSAQVNAFFDEKLEAVHKARAAMAGKTKYQITLAQWQEYENLVSEYNQSLRKAGICVASLSEELKARQLTLEKP